VDSLHSDPVFQVTPDPALDPGFWRPITEEKNTAEKKFFYKKLHFTYP
jgi:hypothetical protein